MSSTISEKDIEKIVEMVLKNVEQFTQKAPVESLPVQQVQTGVPILMMTPLGTIGNDGVFDRVEDAIDAAYGAQKEYAKACTLEDRNRIIETIRKTILANIDDLAMRIFTETGLGRLEDKAAKVILAATKTPGTEDIKTSALSGDYGLTIEEMGAFGLIGAVTPVTNPAETIIGNVISMIAAGNGVVFNVHPSAKNCSAYAVQLLNRAIVSAGGPENLVTMVKEPTLETVKVISSSPKVNLMVGTGGPALVKALLSSGKKAIGAGAGNPPVIVDGTADLALAARSILEGASFDNNILCIAEKEIFVLDSVADELIYEFLKLETHMLTKDELEHVMALTLVADEKIGAKSCSMGVQKEYHVAKAWVGQDASKIMAAIQKPMDQVKLLLCEVSMDHPYVQLEQMMPVLPIVRVKTFEEAVEKAVEAEHGNRHTASIFSRNVDNMTTFAKAINTTIFVKNAATLAGVGFKGEGCTTFTIAGPTGEGITSARTFTRVRRCVLAEGGFRII
ncbi:MAG: aldehyde dehydrogenase EutE [Clostridia bacterium]|nr:aldehyde dehydrogenase EutE [Clostridia bacterium]